MHESQKAGTVIVCRRVRKVDTSLIRMSVRFNFTLHTNIKEQLYAWFEWDLKFRYDFC